MKKTRLFWIGLLFLAGMMGCFKNPRNAPMTAPISSSPSQAEAPTPFSGIVAAHNRVRQRVGVPPLRWSEEVSRYAQDWANRLKAGHCRMQHRSNNGYGENLAWGSGGLSPQSVVEMWAEEGEDYDYADNTCRQGQVCGHYTQVVWAASTELGCGMARCNDGSEIWVCNYNPPGNYIGRKPY